MEIEITRIYTEQNDAETEEKIHETKDVSWKDSPELVANEESSSL